MSRVQLWNFNKQQIMIRILILTSLLITTNIVWAEDTNDTIEIKTLMSVPEKRHNALVLYRITGDDSSPDIYAKQENYYNALKQIAHELRVKYYWLDGFPTNEFAGIDERVDVLVAANYPLCKGAGCSYVDYLQESYRIQMAEETISFMAKAIFERFKDGDVHPAGESAPTFSNWNKQWNKAGKVPNGPNQNLAPVGN
jgi:hypothetical protein